MTGTEVLQRRHLGHLVQPAYPGPWFPPPALVPYQDPHLLYRLHAALKRL